jgi:PPOX class probable F420-dependent enzyme
MSAEAAGPASPRGGKRASARAAIAMSPGEVTVFLEQERVVTLASLGRDGWPHLVPLWYLVRDGEVWAWTYAKSQKARNLERDARCTLQVEAGDAYHELRGVMLKAEAVIHRDLETVAGIGQGLVARYGGEGYSPEEAEAMRRQAPKRIGLQFRVRRTASWDHRKLARS